MAQPICSQCKQSIFFTAQIHKCTNTACGKIICGACRFKCIDFFRNVWCPHCSNRMQAIEEDTTTPPSGASSSRSHGTPPLSPQPLPTSTPSLPTPRSTTEPIRRTGISCPSCGGDLSGRFAKCVHCRSDIFWATNGPGFSNQSQAQAYEAEHLAREEQVAKDRIVSYRRERTKSVLQKMKGSLNLAAPLHSDSDSTTISSAELKRLKAIIADGLKHAEDFQTEMRTWDSAEPPLDERRYDEPLPPALPSDLQEVYEKLCQFRSNAEMRLAASNAKAPLKQDLSTIPVEHSIGSTDNADICLAEDALDPALWQWVLTATACVAAADGKLGKAELDAISEALKAHSCPLAGEPLRQEIIAKCKQVHKESAARVATALCDLLINGGKWRESHIILNCVQSVSTADGIAGHCETDLLRYFTEALMSKRQPG